MTKLQKFENADKSRAILHALGALGAFSSLLALATIYIYYVCFNENKKITEDLKQVVDFQLFWMLVSAASMVLSVLTTSAMYLVNSLPEEVSLVFVGTIGVVNAVVVFGLFVVFAAMLLNPIINLLFVVNEKKTFYFPTSWQKYSVLNRMPKKWVDVLLVQKKSTESQPQA